MSLVLLAWLAYSLWHYPLITVYRYTSSDGEFEEIECPAKGRDLSLVRRRWDGYRADKPGVRLLRESSRDWSNLFLLRDNLLHARWSIPHVDDQEGR